ncbi:hypothetical protein VVR85_09840 [Corynebacterium sp. LK2590]|uniref:hypothetical protein n=1 Tax=unclassified Corynebacterium TaxID=2624378 RepID=UPI0034CF176A
MSYNSRSHNSRGFEHPENDLSTDADFSNVPRPEPHSFDELADEPDPAVIAQRNEQSSRQARWYVGSVLVASFAVAFVLGIIMRLIGGPLCEAGEAAWLCSPGQQIFWGFAVLVVPVFGMLGCGAILVRKYRGYIRWRPWMGVMWVLIPNCMIWIFTGLQYVIVATM